jgi:malate synthase
MFKVNITPNQIGVNVHEQQQILVQREHASMDDLVRIPVAKLPDWSMEEIQQELDNNIQGILGYVVRWVNHGFGASKVPDMNHVDLMEDQATLRISSQHVCNWLHHGIVSESQVMASLKRMAEFVDQQNISTPSYINMSPHFISLSFHAAQDMIFHGRGVANGYTESTLHRRRKQFKDALKGNH